MTATAVTEDVAFAVISMTDSDGEEYKSFALDTGEVFLKTAQGEFYMLAVTAITARDADFINDDDWS